MRFVSLFAGVGGFDLGLEMAGHECIGQVEIDRHCQQVLAKHWPDVPRHDDVRSAIGFADSIGLVERTDLVCGGFPCQDVSVAGKHAGLAGDRTGLFWDALAFAVYVKARWILLENVAGLLRSNQGRDFGTIAIALADAGYEYLEWRLLDSQFFGVPQRRRRIFIVAGTETPNRQPILAESEGSTWSPEAVRTFRNDNSAFAETGTWWDGSPVAPTIDVSLASKGQMMPDKRRMFAVQQGSVVRRPTPVECERLQGFPDDWTSGVPDTQRYKQMGNAVTVNVAHYVGWLLT